MIYAVEPYGADVYGEVEYVASASILTNIYQSNIGFTTWPSDTPANQHFQATVLRPFQYRRSLLSDNILGGVVTQGFGDIILNNNDASYDSVFEQYAIDGRQIEVKIGDVDAPFDSFGRVWIGSASGWEINEQELRINLRDLSARIDTTLQEAFYTGTGGLEGGDDLEGSPKPLTFGECYNVSPVFVGVIDLGDGALYTYQTNARPIDGHLAVYEGGNAYNEVTSGTPSGGEWKDFPDDGVFQIGSTPVERITCDVKGDAGSGGGDYVNTTSEIVQRIVEDFITGIQSNDIDQSSFDQHKSDIPGVIGYHIGTDKVNTNDVLSDLVNGAFSFVGFARNGKLELKIVDQPTNTELLSIPERDIIQAPEVLPPGTLGQDLQAPVGRIKVGYKRNWTVMNQGILNGATEDFRSFAQKQYRVTEDTNPDTFQRHVLASDPPLFRTFFRDQADADGVASRILNLLSGEFRVYRVRAKVDYTILDLANTVVLYYNRFNLRNGARCIVVDLEIDASTNLVTYTLLKP